MSDATTTPTPATSRSLGFAALEHRIETARYALRELWWKASTADRIFAVDRMLREAALPTDIEAKVRAFQDRVRDAWVTARVATALHTTYLADAHLAGLRLTVAERDLNNVIVEEELFDALFLAAEGYLRSVPIVVGTSFRELCAERDRLRAKLVPILPPLFDDAA